MLQEDLPVLEGTWQYTLTVVQTGGEHGEASVCTHGCRSPSIPQAPRSIDFVQVCAQCWGCRDNGCCSSAVEPPSLHEPPLMFALTSQLSLLAQVTSFQDVWVKELKQKGRHRCSGEACGAGFREEGAERGGATSHGVPVSTVSGLCDGGCRVCQKMLGHWLCVAHLSHGPCKGTVSMKIVRMFPGSGVALSRFFLWLQSTLQIRLTGSRAQLAASVHRRARALTL